MGCGASTSKKYKPAAQSLDGVDGETAPPPPEARVAHSQPAPPDAVGDIPPSRRRGRANTDGSIGSAPQNGRRGRCNTDHSIVSKRSEILCGGLDAPGRRGRCNTDQSLVSRRSGAVDDGFESIRRSKFARSAHDDGRMVIRTKLPLTSFYSVDSAEDKVADGQFGIICRVRNIRSGAERVAKSLSKRKVKPKRVEEMIQMHRMIDQPNICALYEVFDDKMNWYFVFEFCTGGSLLEAVSQVDEFSEHDASVILRKVLRSVAYLHQSSISICHRDICPENFLAQCPVMVASKIEPQLIDLGKAKRFTEGILMKGNPRSAADCMSPQALDGCYSELTDVWSCGVVAYALLCGEPPFVAETEKGLQQLVRDATEIRFDPAVWHNVSEDAQSLLRQMLAYEEEDRVSAQEALGHAFFQRNCVSRVSLKKDQWHSLKMFARRNKFHRAALNAIAQRLGHEEIDELRRAFESMDTDNNGNLSVAELKEAVRGMRDGMCRWNSEGSTSSNRIAQVIEAIDVNNSEEINFTEFIAAAIEKKHLQEEGILWSAFQYFDLDGNGKIDRFELQKVLLDEQVDRLVDSRSLDRVMKEADFNGDGMIDFNEFLCMMRGQMYVASTYESEGADSIQTIPLPDDNVVRAKRPGRYTRTGYEKTLAAFERQKQGTGDLSTEDET